MCAIGADFVSVVLEHEGWEWVDEGKPGSPKWGFVSTQVGPARWMGMTSLFTLIYQPVLTQEGQAPAGGVACGVQEGALITVKVSMTPQIPASLRMVSRDSAAGGGEDEGGAAPPPPRRIRKMIAWLIYLMVSAMWASNNTKHNIIMG